MIAKQHDNTNSIDLLHQYCKDIDQWPERWQIDSSDIIKGQEINQYFKLFLIDCIQEGKAKRTIKGYISYLWVLGGELIRRINDYDDDRMLPAKKLLLKNIDESGGPYWHDAYDESDHDRYDAVCRVLFKFLSRHSV